VLKRRAFASALLVVAVMALPVVGAAPSVAQAPDPDDDAIRSAIIQTAESVGQCVVEEPGAVSDSCDLLDARPGPFNIQSASLEDVWTYDVVFFSHAGSYGVGRLHLEAFDSPSNPALLEYFGRFEPSPFISEYRSIPPFDECWVVPPGGPSEPSIDCRLGRYYVSAFVMGSANPAWDDLGDLESALAFLASLLPAPGSGGFVGLRATAPGYGAHDQSFENTEGFATVEVSGVVVDDVTGSPVAGAAIEVLNDGTANVATTGSDGHYSMAIDMGGGSGLGALNLDFRIPPLSGGLNVAVDPPFLTEIGQEALITVGVTDPAGGSVAGTLVRLVALAGGASGAEGTTGSDGTVVFGVVHLDEAITQYRFRVEADEQSTEVVIPVGAVTIERNPTTGEPFEGVLADGVSQLSLQISAPGLAGGEVTAAAALGAITRIDDPEPFHASEFVSLDDQGRGALTYTPPDYLAYDGMEFTRQIGPDTIAHGASDVVTVTLRSSDGSDTVIEVLISVYRPPVMLVHGFIGDPSTWQLLDDHLTGRRFDTDRGTYFGSDPDTIQAQVLVLRRNIETRLNAYESGGIRAARVDLVGHSMGGLISRSYVQDPDNPANVRKVIMVATPNHGARSLDSHLVGPFILADERRHLEASYQLWSGSEFLRHLNAGETFGGHLTPGVEYASLYGRWSQGRVERTLVSVGVGAVVNAIAPGIGLIGAAATEMAQPDLASDGVVGVASARLNGVQNIFFEGVCHSSALAPYCRDPSVTDDPRIMAEVERLLLERIEPGPLVDTSMEVRFEGTVLIQDYGSDNAWRILENSPVSLAPWQQLRTGSDGRAVINLKIGGTTWGQLSLDAESEILVEWAYPQQTKIWHRGGRVRLMTTEAAGGGFVVDLGPENASNWFEFVPAARLTGLGTDFVVSFDGAGVEVAVLDGSVLAEPGDQDAPAALIDPGAAAAIDDLGGITGVALPEPWWDDGFYQSPGFPVLLVAVGSGGLAGLLVGLGLWAASRRRRTRSASGPRPAGPGRTGRPRRLAPLPAPPPVVRDGDKVFCTQCGDEYLDPGYAFCINCGAKKVVGEGSV